MNYFSVPLLKKKMKLEFEFVTENVLILIQLYKKVFTNFKHGRFMKLYLKYADVK